MVCDSIHAEVERGVTEAMSRQPAAAMPWRQLFESTLKFAIE
jgi:hypothetical protein